MCLMGSEHLADAINLEPGTGLWGVVTPYTGLTLTSEGRRTWRAGGRWKGATAFGVTLEGSRDVEGEGQRSPHPHFGISCRFLFIGKADVVLSNSLTPSVNPPHDHFAAEAAHR